MKVLWKNHRIEEATWEVEEEIQKKYPILFLNQDMNFEDEILLRGGKMRGFEFLFYFTGLFNYLFIHLFQLIYFINFICNYIVHYPNYILTHLFFRLIFLLLV